MRAFALVVIFAVIAFGSPGCGGQIAAHPGSDDGGVGDDAIPSSSTSSGGVVGSSSGGSSGGVTGSSSSSGGVTGSSSSSGGGSSGTDSGEGYCTADDGGFTCSNGVVSPPGFPAVCNACIAAMACDAYCTCAADSTPPPDGGADYGGCIGFVNCMIECLNTTDAGVAECAQECSTPDAGPWDAAQIQEGETLLGGLTACTTSCL